jgi:hypothetical protein
MFKRRRERTAPSRPTRSGRLDRRRLMSLGGRAAVGAAMVGVAHPWPAGAAAASPRPGLRSGVVSMVSSRQIVTVPGGLSPSSRVFATVSSDPDQLGYFPVVAAVPDPRTGTIKIQANAIGGTPPYPEVAWFVLD